jgi:hypothetical protein
MKILGINGRQFSPDELTRAIQNTKSGAASITVLASNSGVLESYQLNYQGGAAYPHLERVPSVTDYLDDILKPLASTASSTH